MTQSIQGVRNKRDFFEKAMISPDGTLGLFGFFVAEEIRPKLIAESEAFFRKLEAQEAGTNLSRGKDAQH